MLTFMNSKLTKMTSKTTFSIKVNPMKYQVYIYMYIYIYIEENQEFIHVFYWCISLHHKIYTKCKKLSNLIKDISGHNICSAIKSQQVKKNIFHSVPKTFDFSWNSSVLSHQATFDHSVSCVLLIHKTNKICQNSEKFERNATSITKKKF